MKKLSRNEMKNLKGGSDTDNGFSCESECIIEDGRRTGCEAGETCVNVTCEANTSTCYNICLNI